MMVCLADGPRNHAAFYADPPLYVTAHIGLFTPDGLVTREASKAAYLTKAETLTYEWSDEQFKIYYRPISNF